MQKTKQANKQANRQTNKQTKAKTKQKTHKMFVTKETEQIKAKHCSANINSKFNTFCVQGCIPLINQRPKIKTTSQYTIIL